LENENNRLEKLGQDYSQETVSRLSSKYTKALKDIEELKEAIESYKRQAAKLKAERDELDNEVERLTVQTRDMDLTIQTQAQEIADLKEAVADQQPLVRSQNQTAVDSSALFNQLKPLLGKGHKLTLAKLDSLLE
jgi:chromosome segregation ATPase